MLATPTNALCPITPMLSVCMYVCMYVYVDVAGYVFIVSVGNEEVDDSVTGSSTPEHNLPGSPATVATPPATPTTDPMPPAMGTSPPVTMPPVSPATPASTETIPPNDITTPLNTVATPQRTTGIATLPNESATSASPLNGVCANTASHDLSPSSREGDGFGSTLALDVSLPLEIFATPSSAHEGEAGCKNGGSTADKASAVSSMPEKSTGETDKVRFLVFYFVFVLCVFH